MTGRTLSEYGAALRRHRRSVLLVTLLATAGGVAVASVEPVVHRSTVVVVATPQPPPGSGRDGLRRAPTVDSDARLLTSDRVLARAAQVADYPGGLPALRGNVDVTARATSRVLRLRVTAQDATTARDTADAVAREFLRVRADADDARFQAARDALGAQVVRVTEQLDAAITASGGDARDQEVQALEVELTRLQRQLLGTRASAEASGFVAEPARLAAEGVRPYALTTVVSAGLLGLAAGSAAAVARPSGRTAVPEPRALTGGTVA